MKNNDTENQDPFWTDHKTNRFRTGYRRRPSKKEYFREQTMKDWYGTGVGRMEIMAHRKPPEKIADVVSKVMNSFGMKNAVQLDEVRESWAKLVGADIAKFTNPVSFRNGVLQVEVLHPTWFYVLEREHRAKFEKALIDQTEGNVKSLRLIPGGRQNNTGRKRY